MATLKGTKITPGTTASLNTLVKDIDITEATVYVTIESGETVLTKSNYHDEEAVSLDEAYDESVWIGTDVTVNYTQEETMWLRPGNARVQIGWVFEDGTASKTEMIRVFIPDTIIRGVMRYGRDVEPVVSTADSEDDESDE